MLSVGSASRPAYTNNEINSGKKSRNLYVIFICGWWATKIILEIHNYTFVNVAEKVTILKMKYYYEKPLKAIHFSVS